MTHRPKLHPAVKSVVPRSTRAAQIALRWLGTLAGALVVVQIGRAVDFGVSGDFGSSGVPGSWWIWTVLSIALAAVCGGLGTSQSLKTQASTERKLREDSQLAWIDLGSVRVRGRAGQLLDLATNGAMRAARYRGGFLTSSVAALSAPLVVALVMGFSVGWRIAGLMVLIIVVGPILIGAFQGMNKKVGARFRASQGELRESFLEGIRALESLSYAGAGTAYARRLATINEQHRRKIMRLLAGNQVLLLVMDLVFSLAALMLATFLAVQGRANDVLTLGQTLILILLTVMLVAPVDLIGQFFYIGIGGRAAQRQFSRLLVEAEEARLEDQTGLVQEISEESRGALILDDVTVGWPGAEPILADVSLTVGTDERVTLVGPSGAGKSTLSAVVQGQLRPRLGSVVVAAPVAVVEQRSFLFNGSIGENLRIAKPDASESELWDVLDQANLGDDVRALPDGLETVIGDQGAGLSGGQGQRLAIARALLRDAPILILDEPTSQVDLAGEELILDAIDRASKGRAVLTIAHRSAAVRYSDRILQVSDGTVVNTSGDANHGS